MHNPFKIIKDSSVWHSSRNYSAVNKTDSSIRMGVVKEVFIDEPTNDVRYIVEIIDKNNIIPVSCRLVRNFGGVFNYEEFQLRGYNIDQNNTDVILNITKPGDMVLVAYLGGSGRFGVIIGGLPHPARKPKLDSKKGPQYISEFNGIEKSINEYGEYRLTYKGIPKNIDKLNLADNNQLPEPEYDTEIGTSYLLMDKTGSLELNDNSKKNTQLIKIDKKNGTIDIVSGKISLTFVKEKEAVTLVCKTSDIKAETYISLKTKDTVSESTNSIKIKSPKIAIGSGSTELLDQLSKLIEALGNIQPISPSGPCTPLISTPQWANVESIKSNIKGITGSL